MQLLSCLIYPVTGRPSDPWGSQAYGSRVREVPRAQSGEKLGSLPSEAEAPGLNAGALESMEGSPTSALEALEQW